MIQKNKISLVLPCRNESNHLKDILKLVPNEVDEIIIVSNKSTDDTIAIARSLMKREPRLVLLEDNRTINGIGYGFAHMTGIATATGDIIVGADGDGTYPLSEIANIAKYMKKSKLDFVACHRYPLQKGVIIPLKLQFGVNLLNWEIRLLFGIHIKDALSGMWMFKKEIRNDLKLTMGDWNLSPQIKINAAKSKNIAFGQYSISQEQRLGETKQNYMKTGISHALWILKNRFDIS